MLRIPWSDLKCAFGGSTCQPSYPSPHPLHLPRAPAETLQVPQRQDCMAAHSYRSTQSFKCLGPVFSTVSVKCPSATLWLPFRHLRCYYSCNNTLLVPVSLDDSGFNLPSSPAAALAVCASLSQDTVIRILHSMLHTTADMSRQHTFSALQSPSDFRWLAQVMQCGDRAYIYLCIYRYICIHVSV